MSDVKRIEVMEGILDEHSALLEELDALLSKVEEHQKAYLTLRDYYTSEVFMSDFEKAQIGAFDHIKCGVLSEDAVYDLLTDQHRLGIRLLEVGTLLVKEG